MLFGRVASKGFDEHGLTRQSQLPSAEVEFVDGLKFRRAVTADNKNVVYINGQKVPTGTFASKVYSLTGEGGQLVIDLFNFASLSWKEQRDLLLTLFAENQDELPSPEEVRGRIKTLTAESAEIDGRMKELYSQLKEIPETSKRDLDDELAAVTIEMSSLQAQQQFDDGKLEIVRKALSEADNQLRYWQGATSSGDG